MLQCQTEKVRKQTGEGNRAKDRRESQVAQDSWRIMVVAIVVEEVSCKIFEASDMCDGFHRRPVANPVRDAPNF